MKFLYVCGPTVYNKVHIGNMRPIMSFDLFLRGANFKNKKYIFLHNLTDIDDKIINIAIEQKISEKQVSEKYGKYYLDMLNLYNINSPDYIEKVTTNISMIIDYITKLVENGSAYIKNGSVYFDVTKFSEYGKLSNLNINNTFLNNEEFNEEKNNINDFVLWKKTTKGITWESPWSKGRPGWHTECSALINHILKVKTIDIHGGGIDLIFPHNENENIQNIALHNEPLAKKWIHIGHINWKNEKMSKSLNNFIFADEFSKNYGEDTFRTIILNTNFSAPIDLNPEMIESNIKITNKYLNIFNIANIIIETNLNDKREIFYKNNQNIIKNYANLLENFEFSKINFELNAQIKLFNNVQDLKNALIIKEIFTLLGYKFSTKVLTKNDIDLYQNWKNAKFSKDYKKADELFVVLKKRKII